MIKISRKHGTSSWLPKLESTTSTFMHHIQFQILVPFRIPMIVKAIEWHSWSIKANIVEPSEGCTWYRLDTPMGNKETLLPSHVNVSACQWIVFDGWQLSGWWSDLRGKTREFRPMLQVNWFIRVPFPCQKGMFIPNYLGFKESDEFWKLLR